MKLRCKLVLGLALCLVLALPACTFSERKKLAQASDDFSRGVNIVLTVDEALIDQKLVTDAGGRAIAQGALDVSRAGKEFNLQAQALTKLDGEAKAKLAVSLDAVTDSVVRLEGQGVLHIKSPQSRSAFDAGMGVIKSAIAIVKGIVSK